MQVTSWKLGRWKLWAAAGLSAGLLELPFPIAGPMPAWRSIFAWFGLVPLLWAVLSPECVDGPRPLRRGFLLSYLCGVLWYMGNCYWVRDTMMHYGDMPWGAPTLLLVAYSMVLGLYFGLFGLGVALVRRTTGSTRLALLAAPVLWTALELAAARITSVPWDQLGYSQVDNGLVNQLAPWTGVYGISFVIVAANALLASGYLVPWKRVTAGQPKWRLKALFGSETWRVFGLSVVAIAQCGTEVLPPKPAPTTATAVLIQPNLDVGTDNRWDAPGEWDRHIAEFTRMAGENCKTYIAGIPQTGAPQGEIVCPPYATHPDLVVWPESPAPFEESDPRFQQALIGIAHSAQAPLVVGNIGADLSADGQLANFYNSALVVGSDGSRGPLRQDSPCPLR